VRFTLGGNTGWTDMQRVERLDPFVQDVYARNRAVTKPWVNPGKSSHIWQAALPADLAPGTYGIRAQGTDEYGQPHESMLVVEVTA